MKRLAILRLKKREKKVGFWRSLKEARKKLRRRKNKSVIQGLKEKKSGKELAFWLTKGEKKEVTEREQKKNRK